MTETVEQQIEVESAMWYHFCPICATIMYHGEWNGMIGWVCPDPDCNFFEPD